MTARVRRRPAYRDEGGLADFIDDGGYETGSFTPTFTFATVGDLSVSYNQQVGQYWTAGAMVFIKYRIQWTPTFTTASGNAEFGGLPFSVASGLGAGANGFVAIVQSSGNWALPASRTFVAGAVAGGTAFNVFGHGSGVPNSALDTGEFPSGSQYTIGMFGAYPR